MHKAVAVSADRPVWSTVLGESGAHGGTNAPAALVTACL